MNLGQIFSDIIHVAAALESVAPNVAGETKGAALADILIAGAGAAARLAPGASPVGLYLELASLVASPIVDILKGHGIIGKHATPKDPKV